MLSENGLPAGIMVTTRFHIEDNKHVLDTSRDHLQLNQHRYQNDFHDTFSWQLDIITVRQAHLPFIQNRLENVHTIHHVVAQQNPTAFGTNDPVRRTQICSSVEHPASPVLL